MYFITTMTTPKESEKVKGFPDFSSRCFGYMETLEEAEEALINNKCDMCEALYTYGVIEKLEPGIHSIPEEIGWYKYNARNDKYEPAERPALLKELINMCGVG